MRALQVFCSGSQQAVQVNIGVVACVRGRSQQAVDVQFRIRICGWRGRRSRRCRGSLGGSLGLVGIRAALQILRSGSQQVVQIKAQIDICV